MTESEDNRGSQNQDEREIASSQSPDASNYPQPPSGWKPADMTNPNSTGNQPYAMPHDGLDHDNPAPYSSHPNGIQNVPPGDYGANQQPRMAAIGKTVFSVNDEQVQAFESARKLMMAAQITAIVSLFLGGIFLSMVSVVLAVVSNSRFRNIASTVAGDEAQTALRRTGTSVIVLSAAALVLNVLSFIFIYPMIMQVVQTGDYSSILGPLGGNAPSGTSGTSTWG